MSGIPLPAQGSATARGESPRSETDLDGCGRCSIVGNTTSVRPGTALSLASFAAPRMKSRSSRSDGGGAIIPTPPRRMSCSSSTIRSAVSKAVIAWSHRAARTSKASRNE